MAPAPVTTAPHRANNHERFLPPTTKNASKSTTEFTLEESDTEGGALQPVNDQMDTEWEGFGVEEEVPINNQEEDSDLDSVDAVLESTKEEKPILPKDAEEEELERIIFGDSAGFKQGLDTFSLAGAYGDVSDEDEDAGEDLEAVADQDLFFFDAGPVPAPSGSVPAKVAESDDEDDKPAWEDSDDERLVVSLASVPQLKKLRETVDDDMVNGKEYSRRLRKQYERLYPAPDWALHATRKNKKRRRTMDEDESGEGSASDMDVDDDDLSLQPLAKLLKDADILSRTVRGPVKKRKLQAGTVDIQRLKDISKAGPVSTRSAYALDRLLTRHLVCSHLAILPPDLPTTHFIWAQLDTLPTPCQPELTYSEPAPDLSPHQAHASDNDCLPSFTLRFPHIPERPTPLLSRLECCHGQDREGIACIRATA